MNFVGSEDDVGEEDRIVENIGSAQVEKPRNFVQIGHDQQLAILLLHLRPDRLDLFLPRFTWLLMRGEGGGWWCVEVHNT